MALGERLGPSQWVGGALLLAAVPEPVRAEQAAAGHPAERHA